MVYSPRRDLNEITYLKGRYVSGNDSDKKYAQSEAKKYYDRLRANGYGAEADKYSGFSYDKAYSDYKARYSPEGRVGTSSGSYIDGIKKGTDENYDLNYKKADLYYRLNEENTDKEYNSKLKSNYLNYEREKAFLPEKLSAMGITGGGSESYLSGLQNTYLNNAYEINRERDSKKAQIEAEKRAAYYDYLMGKNENDSKYAEMKYNGFLNDRSFDYQKLRDSVSDNQYRDNFDYQKEIDNRNYGYQRERDAVSDRQYSDSFNYQLEKDAKNFEYQDRVLNFDNAYKSASLGDFGPLARLYGISEDEMRAKYYNLMAYENSFKSSGKGGGSRKSSGGGYEEVDIYNPDIPNQKVYKGENINGNYFEQINKIAQTFLEQRGHPEKTPGKSLTFIKK